eukprot:GHVU01106587.1.p1 GENE.GHVU01106587.1~~GHVU01106587.1.p1  ORF type:complete len:561 (+),score=40.58 GHVU01106587.1:98-1684(+)
MAKRHNLGWSTAATVATSENESDRRIACINRPPTREASWAHLPLTHSSKWEPAASATNGTQGTSMRQTRSSQPDLFALVTNGTYKGPPLATPTATTAQAASSSSTGASPATTTDRPPSAASRLAEASSGRSRRRSAAPSPQDATDSNTTARNSPSVSGSGNQVASAVASSSRAATSAEGRADASAAPAAGKGSGSETNTSKPRKLFSSLTYIFALMFFMLLTLIAMMSPGEHHRVEFPPMNRRLVNNLVASGVTWPEIRHLFRVTWDSRRVNEQLDDYAHPMPDIEENLTYVTGARFFAVIDMIDGYNQCLLAEDSREIFSIVVKSGIYTPRRVPQGASMSPAYFQQVMERVFAPILKKGGLIYIDDLLVYAHTEEQLVSRLSQVFALADAVNLKLSIKKSTLLAESVTWCGKVISAAGISHAPDRIEAIAGIPDPVNGAELYQFTSAANWMRNHMPNFSFIVAPLLDVMNKVRTLTAKQSAKKSACFKIPLDAKVGWGPACREAMRKTREALRNMVSLAHPDPAKRY